MKTRHTFLLAAVVVLLLATGCADKIPAAAVEAHAKVGFWHGLWHGWIVVFAWLVSLFTNDVAIYATYNNGGWYDFGFILGLGLFGGCSCSKK